jgi:hypothetical protein
MRKTAHYLIETADQVAQLARAGREMAEQLETMSNNLMAKAVALDTERQRDEKPEKIGKTARK